MKIISGDKDNVLEFRPRDTSKDESTPTDFGSNSDNLEFFQRDKYARLFLQVEMTDGSWWEVPAMEIADNRAQYYSDKVQDQPNELDLYVKELTYALENEDVLVDWAENNMNWKEVSELARQVRPPNGSDYQEGWLSGMKSLVEHELQG